ncbi:MAG: hypothetical protein VKM01_07060 [Cyanobacteriota bacterium]|nr:hypothetical protein [Cyanobacteriota bacterium]
MKAPLLAVPLLAALALHGLWLASGRLERSPNPALPQARGLRPAADDDTPELLRLSRRLSLERSLRVATPLPPPPPPPAPAAPDLPAAPGRRPAPALARPPRPSPKPVRAVTRATPRTTPGRAKSPAGVGARPLPAPSPQAALLAKLWARAEPPAEVPSPLAGLPPAVELRRMPSAAATGLGLEQPPSQPQRLRDHLLLLWSEDSDLWLLRLPFGGGA